MTQKVATHDKRENFRFFKVKSPAGYCILEHIRSAEVENCGQKSKVTSDQIYKADFIL